jgi:hypothetical protein
MEPILNRAWLYAALLGTDTFHPLSVADLQRVGEQFDIHIPASLLREFDVSAVVTAVEDASDERIKPPLIIAMAGIMCGVRPDLTPHPLACPARSFAAAHRLLRRCLEGDDPVLDDFLRECLQPEVGRFFDRVAQLGETLRLGLPLPAVEPSLAERGFRFELRLSDDGPVANLTPTLIAEGGNELLARSPRLERICKDWGADSRVFTWGLGGIAVQNMRVEEWILPVPCISAVQHGRYFLAIDLDTTVNECSLAFSLIDRSCEMVGSVTPVTEFLEPLIFGVDTEWMKGAPWTTAVFIGVPQEEEFSPIVRVVHALGVSSYDTEAVVRRDMERVLGYTP